MFWLLIKHSYHQHESKIKINKIEITYKVIQKLFQLILFRTYRSFHSFSLQEDGKLLSLQTLLTIEHFLTF